MTQNIPCNHEVYIRYNHGFTDEDERTLLQYASVANLPQVRYYTCGWATGLVVCSSFVTAPDFPEHLRSCHGVVGSDQAKLMCCWVDCYAEMKKESLMRHISERHLEVKYACPNCSEQFTRQHTMQNHVTRKHPGS